MLAFVLALMPVVQAAASPLVTGNGFGFAVVAPDKGAVTRFYSHPYSFMRADPADPLAEGIATPQFIDALGWGAGKGKGKGKDKDKADYVADTHVIRLRSGASQGTFFSPFGLDRPALVISLSGRGSWRARWTRKVRSRKALGGGALLLRFTGFDEMLLAVPLGAKRRGVLLGGNSAWALVALEQASDADSAIADVKRWRAGLPPEALAQREVAEFERWRTRPAVHFASEAERHLWRQSETMLRIAQSREPNRAGRFGNGLIVAALPDVYFTPWVRDMAWSTVALARMGHQAEARAALLAYFNARPTGKMRSEVRGADYQISVVRYFGNGEEEPFFTQEGSTNVEFDSWGEALWALGEYLRRYDDPALLREETYRGRVYDVARDFIVKPLLANSEPFGGGKIMAADTSIWEERQRDAKHFAFSTAMTIMALREFERIAALAGDGPARRQAAEHRAEFERGFDAAFVRGGRLRGTLEPGIKNDIDGALLPIINFGIVRDPAVIADTVERMALLKVASGGYRRVRGTYTDPRIFEFWYEQEEFLFVDFHLAELLRRLGRTTEADAMLGRIVAKSAADHNIIPEMYVAVPCALFPGKIGDPTGALPMVGYGPGAFVLNLIEREAMRPAR